MVWIYMAVSLDRREMVWNGLDDRWDLGLVGPGWYTVLCRHGGGVGGDMRISAMRVWRRCGRF